MSVASWCSARFCAVLCVCFCTAILSWCPFTWHVYCVYNSHSLNIPSIYIMSCPPFCPLSVVYLCVMIGCHMWPQTLPCVFKCMISAKPVFYMPLITYTVVRKCFHLCSAFFGFWHDTTYQEMIVLYLISTIIAFPGDPWKSTFLLGVFYLNCLLIWCISWELSNAFI